MIHNYLCFALIFLVGEIIFNMTFLKYLKKYFKVGKTTPTEEEDNKFLKFDISIFKGLLERLVLFFALSISLTQILIVYGAIKIGTRFDRNDKIKNDYFLIGNFSSILISILYYFIFSKIMRSPNP
ncbi:MAG: hypothetical protein C0446_07240 [Chitinophaga sp.]|nr:hypothetical protein [Chitinophaga sp.]